MLFAGCSGCQRVTPLLCGGQFFSHVPLAAVETVFGPGCSVCGPLPNVFTCPACLTTQHLYLHGLPFSLEDVEARGIKVAPVVDAPQSAPDRMLKRMLEQSASAFAVEFGGAAAQQFIQAFAGRG